MFAPKWKKEARLLVKGARKFVHYKRDLLKSDRVAEIESRRDDLLTAIKTNDRAKADEASKQLRATCERSLPYTKPPGWFEENVEVMFVAIVVALGLRAYFLQPFRIPTGSMQPTLNGIIGKQLKQEEWPNVAKRMTDAVLRGRSYVRVVNDRDREIAVDAKNRPLIRDIQFYHFFSRSEIVFRDGSSIRLPAPLSQMYEIGLRDAINTAMKNRGVLPAGTVLGEGTIDAGDLVLVDRVSYNFRRPDRGEVFVFDTRGIKGIQDRSGEQAAGTHYIKRLCGVPGDTLSIDSPHLLVNGKVANEFGIQRVIEHQGAYSGNRGYILADTSEDEHRARNHQKPVQRYLDKPGQTFTLAKDAPYGFREYAAFGDNTANSLDSRYWGSVKEFNLVGPALFSLWPVTTGHWGFIR